MLNSARDSIAWRKNHKILNSPGYLDFVETNDSNVIVFVRSDELREHSVLLGFNFGDREFIMTTSDIVTTIPAQQMIQIEIK